MGSGFVIDGDGHILTNNHVVSAVADRQDMQVSITFWDGGKLKEVPAKIIGRDPKTDLAAVKVGDIAGLTVAQLGDSNAAAVGDTVIVMGSPQGLGGTVTPGIVSAPNQLVRPVAEGTDTDGYADAVQTDASINPGNLSGPLVDIRGAAVGINTVIFSSSGGSQGLGFVTLISSAVAVAEQFVVGEQPVHPGIGVIAHTISNGALTGAEVASILPGGVADQEGLQEGDVITAVGDRAVSSADELMVVLWTVGTGNEAVLKTVHHGAELEARITPEQGGAGFPASADLVDLVDLAAQCCMRGARQPRWYNVFSNVGWGEILVLFIPGLVLAGPERLSKVIEDVRVLFLAARAAISDVCDNPLDEFGENFDDLRKPLQELNDLRRLSPETAITRTLFDGDDIYPDMLSGKPAAGGDGTGVAGAAGAASVTGAAGQQYQQPNTNQSVQPAPSQQPAPRSVQQLVQQPGTWQDPVAQARQQ